MYSSPPSSQKRYKMKFKLVFFFCVAVVFPAVLVSKNRIRFSFFTTVQLGVLALIFYLPISLILAVHLTVFFFLLLAVTVNSYRLVK